MPIQMTTAQRAELAAQGLAERWVLQALIDTVGELVGDARGFRARLQHEAITQAHGVDVASTEFQVAFRAAVEARIELLLMTTPGAGRAGDGRRLSGG